MRTLTLLVCILSMCNEFNAQFGSSNRRWFRPWRPHYLEDDLRDGPILDHGPNFLLVTPGVLRVANKEKILLEALGLSKPVEVSVQIRDFPQNSKQLWQGTVTLNSDNNYRILQTIEINPNDLRPKVDDTIYVQIIATFEQYQEVKQISKVSFLSGYIFIQTDKPVYNPGDTVRFRAFISNADFQAFTRTISVEIQNPEGITVHTTMRSKAANGIYSNTYGLLDIVKEGKWKVVAKFDQWKENTFSADFEVKNYVLPAFNVTLIPKKSYFSLEDQELKVEVYARYLYGEKVDGVAYVVFGVERNGHKVRLPSTKQVNDLNGGTAILTIAELKNAYPDINSIVGSSIYVKASVLTKSGSDLVDAVKTGIKIVFAPYVLAIKDTPKFFKPGLPFEITVTVSNHDGSPAPNVPVKITLMSSPILVHSGTIRVSLNMPSGLEPMIITAETVIPTLKQKQQSKAEWYVMPYLPFNSERLNLLHITLDTNTVKVGQTLNFKLHLRTFSEKERNYLNHVSYIVLNKGRIIHTSRASVEGHEVINVPLLLTSEMLPAFRIVVYCVLPWLSSVEVVADSILVDVESQCVGSLKVEGVSGEVKNSYTPGNSFSFQVRGDPGAKVSLVAVDNSIFLLSNSRLTQRKIWDTLRQGDLGCSPGGGKNSMGVFLDAGLNFQSSFNVATGRELPCYWLSRRKRAVEQLHLRNQLEKTYSDQHLQRCCSDGMKDIPMPYPCRRRALYITENWSCVMAFLQCCSKYRGEVLGVVMPPPSTTPEPTTAVPISPEPTYAWVDTMPFLFGGINIGRFKEPVLARAPTVHHSLSRMPEDSGSHGERGKMDVGASGREREKEFDDVYELDVLDDIYVRTKFFESWLWTDVELPGEPEADGLAVSQLDHVLPDSITQWGVLGVSASSKTGFCVAEPFNIRAWKRFFVDLRLPRTAARNEHVEVKAVLHNYMNEDLKALVILAKTEDMCSGAFTGDHKQEVFVKARSSVLIPYTVIPLRAGELPLQVTAISSNLIGQDAIRKVLRVVVEGIQKTAVRSFVLNPADKGDSDGNQLILVYKTILTSVVPNSIPDTFVNVRGNLLADSIDNSINKDSLAALIRMPGGCVEQNLASITLPLIAVQYLDSSLDWKSVGVHRRDEALLYIRKGYENQLHYRKTDNSYPPYRNEGTSTWITAFVVKVFSMASSTITVDRQHICGPLHYLLKHKQLPSGSFKEDNPVYTTSMTGGLQGAESRETLTAFVLIALAEAQNAECSNPEINVTERFRSAGVYLKERYQELRRPYSVAIACYALAVSNQGCSKSVLLKSASPDRTHWPDEYNTFFTLEATGYALLALLKGGHFEEAAAPFKWLNQQRRFGGGYGSTQSTVVVLQALSEYLVKKPPPADRSLRVDVRVPGRSEIRWAFTPQLAHVARSSRVPLDQDFTVLASGDSQGILEVVTIYNELPDAHEKSSCNGFDLNVTITESSETPPADVEKVYKLSISVRALTQQQVRMAVLDISLPTGFEPETSDLELLTNAVDRYINNFQVVDNLSDRGSLIIHLFKVSNREVDIISFRLNQKFKVGLLQPSTVTVYQYYNTDQHCSRFYTPPEDKEQLSQICKDNVCRCTQGDCCVMKKAAQNNAERKKAACSGIHHVYKVRVLSVSMSQYDRYEVEILRVIKEGSEVGLKQEDTRLFLSHAGCRAGLNLLKGQDYLIIGPSSDVWHAGSDKNGYTYTLGKATWVEHWPSSAECNAAELDTCRALDEFVAELGKTGCRS